jgi:hypothetical protein
MSDKGLVSVRCVSWDIRPTGCGVLMLMFLRLEARINTVVWRGEFDLRQTIPAKMGRK